MRNLVFAFVLLTATAAFAEEFHLIARSRQGDEVSERPLSWDTSKTAVIICDMWDQHWCKAASSRVAEMAPHMNDLVNALRASGVLIIHCPSDTMNYYKDHPARKGRRAKVTGSRPAPG